jgi:hypothetical protein
LFTTSVATDASRKIKSSRHLAQIPDNFVSGMYSATLPVSLSGKGLPTAGAALF